MYKRRARILFLCAGDPAPALIAQGYARALGAEWLEARAALVRLRDGNGPCGGPALEPALLEWADLVVTIGAHAEQRCPDLPSGTRCTHWPLAPGAGEPRRPPPVQDLLRERVQGMIGGLRMLARADAHRPERGATS